MPLGGSVSPPFFLGACLNLFHPGAAITCSTCLHGNGWVRACPLNRVTFPSQHGVTGDGGIHLFLCECLSLTRALLALEVEDGGILRGTPAGCPPSWRGVGLLVFLTEDPSHPPLGWLTGRRPSSQPRVARLPCTSMS